MALRIAILGVTGRMGKALVREVSAAHNLQLVAGIGSAESASLGDDIGVLAGIGFCGILTTSDINTAARAADVMIDFSDPKSSVHAAACCASANCAHIIGTTGFSSDQEGEIRKASQQVAIVKSGSFSIGISILENAIRRISGMLGYDFDAEIVDFHHRKKLDAPSGTALMLGKAVASGREAGLADLAVYDRTSVKAARRDGDIGFAMLRAGSVVSEHAVIFAGEGERIELSHKAESRRIYAKGAIRAAIWAHDRAPGLYAMNDVLNIDAIFANQEKLT